MLVTDFTRLAAGVILLVYASVLDLRTREVNDWVWWVLALLGMCLFLLEREVVYALILIPSIILFANAFVEPSEKTKIKDKKIERKLWATLCIVGIGIFLYQFYNFYRDYTFLQTLVIPGIILLAYLFYHARLLFGGADAKAWMSLAFLVPFYPTTRTIFGYFLPIWPFPLVILTNAVIISLLIPVCFLIYNLGKRNIHFPLSFLGYKLRVEEASSRFVWLLERVRNGKIEKIYFPKEQDKNKEIELLRKECVDKVWVTPKIPFMVPLCIGFILAFTAGDLMYKLLTLVYGW